MSYDALVAIAPLLDAKRFRNPEWEKPGRDSYWGGSLQLLPREVALLVNHEKHRQIGVVRALFELDWTDGKWVVADATVTDPPEWLKRGTPASYGRHNVHANPTAEGAERVTRAFVSEVSVLSPGVEPAEPLARVITFAPAEQPKAPPSLTPDRGEVIVHPTPARRSDSETDELDRRIAWAERRTGRPADVEAIVAAMQRELHGPSLRDLAHGRSHTRGRGRT